MSAAENDDRIRRLERFQGGCEARLLTIERRLDALGQRSEQITELASTGFALLAKTMMVMMLDLGDVHPGMRPFARHHCKQMGDCLRQIEGEGFELSVPSWFHEKKP
jgi:hypothetical protein